MEIGNKTGCTQTGCTGLVLDVSRRLERVHVKRACASGPFSRQAARGRCLLHGHGALQAVVQACTPAAQFASAHFASAVCAARCGRGAELQQLLGGWAQASPGLVGNGPHLPSTCRWVSLPLFGFCLAGCGSCGALGCWAVPGRAGVPHSDIEQQVGEFWDAVGPYVQHRFTGTAQFFDVDLAACDAACFHQDVGIDLRKLVASLVSEWSAWAVRGMIPVAVEGLLAA